MGCKSPLIWRWFLIQTHITPNFACDLKVAMVPLKPVHTQVACGEQRLVTRKM